MTRFLFHIKTRINSFSVSLYRSGGFPFLTRMIISIDPLIWRLWRRKNSLKYRFILFRRVAGPTSFFTTMPKRLYLFAFSRRKNIKFFEVNLLPDFITCLKSWGRAILSLLVNLNDPFTKQSAFFFPSF